jgi:hypothetical protein
MRGITNASANREPKWRHNREALTSGFDPRWRPASRANGQPSGTRAMRRA